MNTHLARIRADRFALLLIAIAVMGAGLVLARQVTYGPSLHSDSVHYLVTARELLAGDIFIENHRDWWPPLFPLLLAAGSFGVLDPLDAAGPVNAICFGLTVLVAGHWLRRHLRSRLLVVWGCIALALAIPVAWIAAWVMTEAPFILFMTLALSFTSAFLYKPKRSTLLWAAVFTALAWLTRYIGIATVITIVLMLLFQRDAPPARKAQRILGYGLVSSIPMILLLIRNYIAVGNLTTSRQVVDYSLPDILERTAFFVGGWIGLYRTGGDIDETTRIYLAITLLIIVGFLGLMLHRNPRERERWRKVYPFVLCIPVFYILHVLGMFRGNTHHGLQERHIIPVYIMIIPIFLTVIDGMIRARMGMIPSESLRIPAFRVMLFPGTILVMSGWILYGMYINHQEIRWQNSPDHRHGYQAGMYADSELIEFINRLPSDGNIIGNIHTEAIYFHAYEIREHYSIVPVSLEDFIQFTNHADEYYLAYSYDPDVTVEYSREDLYTIPNLDIMGSFSDGLAFQILVFPEEIWGTYDSIASGTPIARSDFSIYFNDRILLYTTDTCDDSRISPHFFLHIVPQDTNDLHSSRRQYGFDNFDFVFRMGPRYDPNRCMRSVLLSDYPIASIRTGQYDETGELWGVDILWGN